MTYPRRYPVRYSEEEDALHAKVLTVTTDSEGIRTSNITSFFQSGITVVGNGVKRASHQSYAVVNGVSDSIRSTTSNITASCTSLGERGLNSVSRFLSSVMHGDIDIQRSVGKTITLLFNLSVYPLTYASSYILPGIGSVLSNASGYVYKNVLRNITGNAASESGVMRNLVNTITSHVEGVSNRSAAIIRSISGDGSVLMEIPRHATRLSTAIVGVVANLNRSISRYISSIVENVSDISHKSILRIVTGTASIVGGVVITRLKTLVGSVIQTTSIPRNVHKTITLIFNLSTYPITYAQSYILPGIGSGLSKVYGFIERTTSKHILSDTYGVSTETKHTTSYKHAITNGLTNIVKGISRTVSSAVSGIVSVIRTAFWRPVVLIIETEQLLHVVEVEPLAVMIEVEPFEIMIEVDYEWRNSGCLNL